MEARTERSLTLDSPPRRLVSPRETIDLLSKSRQAAFGMESNDRIVYWNRPCEKLLGYTAAQVLGKHCFEIVAGRDENGNVYCCRSCPVSRQARTGADPVHPFTLVLRDAAGRERPIRFRTFAVPAVHPELSVIVHVVCDPGEELSKVEAHLARGALQAPAPRWKGVASPAPSVMPSPRERDILLGFAEGMSTAQVAQRLHIAPVTVRNHTQRILLKFGVHSKLAAVVYAYRHQLL